MPAVFCCQPLARLPGGAAPAWNRLDLCRWNGHYQDPGGRLFTLAGGGFCGERQVVL